MTERMKIEDYYNNVDEFISDVNAINVRKLVHESDKELIRKLKRWYKTYGDSMNLYESQYARLKKILSEIVE